MSDWLQTGPKNPHAGANLPKLTRRSLTGQPENAPPPNPLARVVTFGINRLVRVRLVAITGGSGSGKTWLARRLKRRLGRGAVVLALDDFYRDLSHLAPRARHRVNFDRPSAIDWRRFAQCLRSLLRGQRTPLPRYDFATHTRLPQARWCKPRPIVLLDGLWLLRSSELRRLYALSLYVDTPEALRLARRLRRDQQERGRSRASILRQFRRQVAPMHRRYVAPQRARADRVLGPAISPRLIDWLAAALISGGSFGDLKDSARLPGPPARRYSKRCPGRGCRLPKHRRGPVNA